MIETRFKQFAFIFSLSRWVWIYTRHIRLYKKSILTERYLLSRGEKKKSRENSNFTKKDKRKKSKSCSARNWYRQFSSFLIIPQPFINSYILKFHMLQFLLPHKTYCFLTFCFHLELSLFFFFILWYIWRQKFSV